VRTILLVTHNIHEACYLGDRVVVMSAHPGTVVAEIAVDAKRPRRLDDPRLAEFTGIVRDLIDRSEPVPQSRGVAA